MMAFPVLLAALTVAQADSLQGAIEGSVYRAGGAATETLPDAWVELSVGPWTQVVDTDADGRYRFERVGAGPHFLTAWRAGYDTARVEVIVPAGRTVYVDLTLHERPIVLPGVDVIVSETGAAAPFDSVRPRGEHGPIGEVGANLQPPLAESGLSAWAQRVAGNPTRDPGDVLYMRGSASDLKLVLLDGAPVYTPFHVGGLLPSFDASLLQSGALHVGAAPVRYDGGLSYIMDLRVRKPTSSTWRGRGTLDLVSAGFAAEGPLGENGGAVLAARGLHPFVNGFLGEGASPYGYGDVLVKTEARLGNGHRLGLTSFWNRESVALDHSPQDLAVYASRLPESATWGNQAISLGYGGPLWGGELTGRAAFSRYEAELPFAAEVPSFLQGLTRNGKLTADLSLPWQNGWLRMGGSVDVLSVDYVATETDTSLSERTRSRAVAGAAAVYGEADRPLSDDVRIRGGLRATAFSRGQVRLSPRLGVTWLFSEDASVTLAAGRYHQLTPFTDDQVEGTLGLNPPTDVTFESVATAKSYGDLLGVASATHFLVSLDHQVTESTRLGLEGFYKRFDDLGAVGERLNASGVDLRIRKGGERLRGWLGYSLNWFWAEELNQTDPFAGRHLLSAGLLGTLFDRGDLDVRLTYGGGLPFTAVPLGAEQDLASPAGPDVQNNSFGVVTTAARGDPPLTGGPSGDFLRLDAELSTAIGWEIGARRTVLRPYLKVLNALDRRDALFFYFEPWRDDDARPLAELSLLPVFGVEWTF